MARIFLGKLTETTCQKMARIETKLHARDEESTLGGEKIGAHSEILKLNILYGFCQFLGQISVQFLGQFFGHFLCRFLGQISIQLLANFLGQISIQFLASFPRLLGQICMQFLGIFCVNFWVKFLYNFWPGQH